MSYLVLPNGVPDFNKAVISLWFRVEPESIKAATAQYAAWQAANEAAPTFVDPPLLCGVIPLFTFGAQGSWQEYTTSTVSGGSYIFEHYVYLTGPSYVADNLGPCSWQLADTIYPDGGHHVVPVTFTSYALNGPKHSLDMSYIGVDCSAADGTAYLSVNIQMNKTAERDNNFPLAYTRTQIDPYQNYDPIQVPITTICSPLPPNQPNPEFGLNDGSLVVLPFLDYATVTTYISAEKYTENQTEMFRTLLDGQQDPAWTPNPKVTPGEWHHLLLSFDLSDGCQTTGVFYDDPTNSGIAPSDHGVVKTNCKLWIAFDDKNLTKTALTYYWPEGTDPNTWISKYAYETYNNKINYSAYASGPTDDHRGHWITNTPAGAVGLPTYDFPVTLIPASVVPAGIPADSRGVASVRHVEMAEFQMFTGVILDTSIEKNRRMFISAKGTPVDPALVVSSTSLPIGDPATWEPGADIVPTASLDPNAPVGKRGLGKPVVSLTRTNQNWIRPLNLGSAHGKLARVGKVKPFTPEPQLGK